MNHKTTSILILFPVAILLSGCADLSVLQPAVDTAEFYFIDSPLDTDVATRLDSDGPAVLIGPSSVAKYLDQPQIVTLGQPNQLLFSETKRWAEPLMENINRVLIDHLSMELSSSQIGFLRIMGDIDWDYRVGYHVYQLVGKPGEQVNFQVSWWIVTRDGTTREFGESVYAQSIDGEPGDFNAYVHAIERLIGRWSNEVSRKILELED